MFQRARLNLTAWYLVIIMTISLLFSFSIYSSITAEFNKFERMQVKIQAGLEDGSFLPPGAPGDHFFRLATPDPTIIENAKNRLLFALLFINLIILWLSGVAGYFLAGRTLRPIQKMVDEQKRFITDASHELRTPLTALRSEIEVSLRNKQLTLGDTKKLLESNLEEVIDLQRLSDNLLTLAQNGKILNHSHLTILPLREILADAIKKVNPLAKKKQITIENSVEETTVKGVQDRLTEVFVILLDNAIKYSNVKSKVNLSSRIEKNIVHIAIKDEGIGIDKKDLINIFDRFYRADQSRSKSAGYGLGLSIAKKIVDAHKGTLGVKSNLEKGTTFTVSLQA